MKKALRWTFRVLFILAIVYHIWSFANYGFGAFNVMGLDKPLITQTTSFKITEIGMIIAVNLLNYVIQLGLPLFFLYQGWFKK